MEMGVAIVLMVVRVGVHDDAGRTQQRPAADGHQQKAYGDLCPPGDDIKIQRGAKPEPDAAHDDHTHTMAEPPTEAHGRRPPRLLHGDGRQGR